jgi:hypothetical protein
LGMNVGSALWTPTLRESHAFSQGKLPFQTRS